MKIKFKILFLVAFLSIPQIVNACSCGLSSFIEDKLSGKSERAIVSEAKNIADAVFIGKVIEVNERADGIAEVKFVVDKVWKGTIFQAVSVFTTNRKECCNCGFLFRVGEVYLVYASGENELTTSQCTRTTLKELAKIDKKYLGKPIPIKKQN